MTNRIAQDGPAHWHHTAFRLAMVHVFQIIGGCAPAVDRSIADPRSRVTKHLDTLIAAEREVGLQYVVVTETDVVLDYAAGSLDAKTSRPVTPESTFLTSSTTKVLTAAAVLRLVEQGRLALDDPLSKHVPQHPYGQEVTLRNLMNHSSGVPSPMPLRWVHTPEQHATFDEARVLRRVLEENPKLQFAPGQEYAYSNISYWLLGKVIESASGRPYCDFLRTEIFAPLDIVPSELDCAIADLERHARGHQRRWTALGLLLPLLTDASVWDDNAGKWARFQHLVMNGPAYGGVFGSARGYAKFLQDLLRFKSRLLSPDVKSLFLSEQRTSTGKPLPTTLGWHRGELDGIPYFSKPGGGPGVSSNVRLYPEQKLGTVFLSNRMRVRESEIQDFSDTIDREIVKAHTRSGHAQAVDSRAWNGTSPPSDGSPGLARAPEVSR